MVGSNARGAACIGSLIDRLVHNAEIIPLEGDSYRLKEARLNPYTREGLLSRART